MWSYFTAVIVLGWCGTVMGLKCYNCTSTTEPKCGDKFSLNANDTKYIFDHCDTCIKSHNRHAKVYNRECKKSSSKSFHVSIGCDKKEHTRTCSCNRDLCNGARTELTAVMCLVFVCVSVYFMYSFLSYDISVLL